MIDPRDVGAAAAAVVTGADHAGRTLVLTGPEAIGYEQVATELAAATGRPVEFVDVPDEGARQALLAAGMPEFVAQQLVSIFGMLRQDPRAGARSGPGARRGVDPPRARHARRPQARFTVEVTSPRSLSNVPSCASHACSLGETARAGPVTAAIAPATMVTAGNTPMRFTSTPVRDPPPQRPCSGGG